MTHFGTLRLSLDQFDDFPHELVKGEQVDIFGRNRSPLHLVMEGERQGLTMAGHNVNLAENPKRLSGFTENVENYPKSEPHPSRWFFTNSRSTRAALASSGRRVSRWRAR